LVITKYWDGIIILFALHRVLTTRDAKKIPATASVSVHTRRDATVRRHTSIKNHTHSEQRESALLARTHIGNG